MKQAQHSLTVRTAGRGLYEVTRDVAGWVAAQGIADGLLTAFCRHTSASLTIQENADPDVMRDLEQFFKKLVPEDPHLYRHTIEGPDDMPAHIKAVLLGSSLTLPIRDGQLNMGTWQGIYLCEHRDRGGRRRLVVTLHGQRE